MTKPTKLQSAAAMLGRQGLGKRKAITEAERERRRTWAVEMTRKREEKRKQRKPEVDAEGERVAVVAKQRFVVIDRKGHKWVYWAENVQHAMTLARTDGIDAVAGKQENKPNEKGEQ